MIKCPKCGHEFELEEKTKILEEQPTEEKVEQITGSEETERVQEQR